MYLAPLGGDWMKNGGTFRFWNMKLLFFQIGNAEELRKALVLANSGRVKFMHAKPDWKVRQENVAQLKGKAAHVEDGRLEKTKANSVSISSSSARGADLVSMASCSDVSEFLERNDWFLLLDHELKARRIALTPRFVVSVLQSQENPLHSLRFYTWISNVDPLLVRNQFVKNVLVNALHRNGPLVISMELLNDIKNSGYRVNEDLLCVLIGSWGRLGLANYCDEIFGQISFLGIRPTTRLYNAVIDALVKSDSLDLAYFKFQQMSADNCKPDRFTYNMLVHGVCRIGVVDEALRLVKQMENSGYFPNVFTFTILIDGFCNARKVEEAFGVLQSMKARNVSPNESTFRSLIHGAFRSSSPLKALELTLNFMKNEHLMQNVVCNTLLCCLSVHRMAKEAGALLKKLGERGYLPDSLTFNMTTTCLIKGLDPEEVCCVVDMFIEKGVKLGFEVFLELIRSLFKAGRGIEGDHYLDAMVRDGLLSNVVSYNMLIDCFCKADCTENASKVFREMLHLGIQPNLITFNTLISRFCKDGAIDKTQEMLKMLLQHGLKPDNYTFSSVIDGLCRAHQVEDAMGCFHEMVAWGVSPNTVTYNVLMRSLCVLGEVGLSMKLLTKMQMVGISPDVCSFNALIQGFCRVGKIDKAKKLFASMLTLGLVPDGFTYNSFIRALCDLGRLEEAKDMFFSMEMNGSSPDSFVCNSMLEILVHKGHLKEARKIANTCIKMGFLLNPFLNCSG